MKRLLWIASAIVLLASCHDPASTGITYNINLEENIKNINPVPLSTLGSKLEYVPLETDTGCLIQNITGVDMTDSELFVSDYDKLLKFDVKGNFIKQIGKKGRGPGEYNSVGNFIIDKENGEIFILSARNILVYDYEGRFLRDFQIEVPARQFLLNENGELIIHPFNIPNPDPDAVYSWYITDRNGTAKVKLINTLRRVNRGGLIVPVSPLYMFDKIPHFMEFGVDTLYKYIKSKKIPYAVFDPGSLKIPPDPTMSEVRQINGKIWVSDIRETRKYFFVNVWMDLSGPISNCIYDKSSSEFSVLKDDGFVNDIDGGLNFWPRKIINEDLMLDYADAFKLIEAIKNNPVKDQSDKMPDVVKALTEVSNPVLIILKR